MKKKLFAIIMSAMMIVSLMPAMSFAGEPVVGAQFRVAGVGNEALVEDDVVANLNMVKEGKYKYIDATTLKSWIDANKSMTVIDTMPKAFYDLHHVPTAINAVASCGKFSPEAMRGEFTAEQKAGLKKAVGYKAITKKTSKKAKAQILKDRKKVIVVYCGFCGCDRSHTAAKYLVSLGYTNVYRQIGGAAAWEDEGYEFVATEAAAQ